MELENIFDDLKLHKLRYEPNIDYLYRPFYQPNMDYVYKPTDHPGLDYLYKPKDQTHFGFLYEPIPDYLIPDRPPYRLHRSKHRSHKSSSRSHLHHKCNKTQSDQSNHLTTDSKPNTNKNIEYENKLTIDHNFPLQNHDEYNKTQPNHSAIIATLQNPIHEKHIDYSKSSPNQQNLSSHDNIDKPQSLYTPKLRSKLKHVAQQNIKYTKRYPFLVDKSHVETITDVVHQKVKAELNQPRRQLTPVYVEKCTLFDSIMFVHNRDPKSQILVLNSADPVTPGGGYLDGDPTEETSLCLHSLLYPTLEQNAMYSMNKGNKIDGSDVMIYSPNVSVFRDELYSEMVHPFKIDVISATPVDNRKCELVGGPKMMERRIRKILNLAAAKKTEVLILGPFGCGALKNDPQLISEFFYKALVVDGMKDYFAQVIFAVPDDDLIFDVFSKRFRD